MGIKKTRFFGRPSIAEITKPQIKTIENNIFYDSEGWEDRTAGISSVIQDDVLNVEIGSGKNQIPAGITVKISLYYAAINLTTAGGFGRSISVSIDAGGNILANDSIDISETFAPTDFIFNLSATWKTTGGSIIVNCDTNAGTSVESITEYGSIIYIP